MTRLLRLGPAGLVAIACAGITLGLGAQTTPARPNILLAIADDWSWPHAGAYGDPTVKTPVFDRIARESIAGIGIRTTDSPRNEPNAK